MPEDIQKNHSNPMPETTKKTTVKHTAAPRVAATHRAVATPKEPKAIGVYIEAVGRRKTSVARVRLFKGTGVMTVNDKDAKRYFPLPRLVADALAPLSDLKIAGEWDVVAKVSGGGIHAQAGAIRLGIARALVKKNEEWKKLLRTFGFLTRDSRMVERKKYGLKKARRSPQWAKR
jgi:small subunit ribosomal protein S9